MIKFGSLLVSTNNSSWTCVAPIWCSARRAIRSLGLNCDRIWDLVAFNRAQLVDMKSLCAASYLVLSTTNATILWTKKRSDLLILSKQQLVGMKPTGFGGSCQWRCSRSATAVIHRQRRLLCHQVLRVAACLKEFGPGIWTIITRKVSCRC